MNRSLEQSVHALHAALQDVRRHFSPDTPLLELRDALPALRELRKVTQAKADLDILIAFLADKNGAGNLVYSSKPADFLMKIFGISFPEAASRIAQGRDLYGEATAPSLEDFINQHLGPHGQEEPDSDAHDSEGPRGRPDSESGSGTGSGSDPEGDPGSDSEAGTNAGSEAGAQRRAQAEREEAERLRREREAQKKLQDDLKENPVDPERRAVITKEMQRLLPSAPIGKKELTALAMEEARHRNIRDLRRWLRNRIDKENGAARNPAQIHGLREFTVSPPDAMGGARFSGYAPPALLALLENCLAPAKRPPHDGEKTDLRTAKQRRADALFAALHAYGAADTKNRSGVGSIVVSLTKEDIDLLDEPALAAKATFATNTHARLGAAKLGFTCLHSKKGNPLALGRFERSASLDKKIALVASELVCTAPGCDEPAINCDTHHLWPFSFGGDSLIDNLTTLCRRHHVDNNDARDPERKRPYMTRDEQTGRVGRTYPRSRRQYRPQGSQRRLRNWEEQEIRFNDSEAARMSASARIREREQVFYDNDGDHRGDGHQDRESSMHQQRSDAYTMHQHRSGEDQSHEHRRDGRWSRGGRRHASTPHGAAATPNTPPGASPAASSNTPPVQPFTAQPTTPPAEQPTMPTGEPPTAPWGASRVKYEEDDAHWTDYLDYLSELSPEVPEDAA